MFRQLIVQRLVDAVADDDEPTVHRRQPLGADRSGGTGSRTRPAPSSADTAPGIPTASRCRPASPPPERDPRRARRPRAPLGRWPSRGAGRRREGSSPPRRHPRAGASLRTRGSTHGSSRDLRLAVHQPVLHHRRPRTDPHRAPRSPAPPRSPRPPIPAAADPRWTADAARRRARRVAQHAGEMEVGEAALGIDPVPHGTGVVESRITGPQRRGRQPNAPATWRKAVARSI